VLKSYSGAGKKKEKGKGQIYFKMERSGLTPTTLMPSTFSGLGALTLVVLIFPRA